MPTELQQMAMGQVLDGIDAYTEYIEHYGIQGKSGRYPLGSGDRPYQDDRFASRRAKKAYDKAKVKADKKRAKEKELAAKEKAEKEAKEKKAAEKLAEQRKQILQDPAKLSKHMNDEVFKFTKDEIKDSMEKFQWQKSLNDLSNAKLNAARQKMDSILGFGNTAVSYYNFIASVKNSIDPDSKLPILKAGKDNREDIIKRNREEAKEKDNAKLREENIKKVQSETEKNKASAEAIRSQRLNEERESVARYNSIRSQIANDERESNAKVNAMNTATEMQRMLKNLDWVSKATEIKSTRLNDPAVAKADRKYAKEAKEVIAKEAEKERRISAAEEKEEKRKKKGITQLW